MTCSLLSFADEYEILRQFRPGFGLRRARGRGTYLFPARFLLPGSSPEWMGETSQQTLLAGGGLMIESFRRVYQEDLGFRPDPVLAIELLLPPSRYPSDQLGRRNSFVSGVTDRLSRLPDVASVAVTNVLPLTGFWGTTDFAIEGHPLRKEDSKPTADNRLITPGYFSTMSSGLLRGRDFNDSDRSGAENVAIINSTFARRYVGGENPLDKILELGDAVHPERWRIVGEVSDVRAFGPEEPAHADLYRPLSHVSFPLLAFVIRTTCAVRPRPGAVGRNRCVVGVPAAGAGAFRCFHHHGPSVVIPARRSEGRKDKPRASIKD